MKLPGPILPLLCLLGLAAAPPAAPADRAATERLHALFQSEWERDLAEDPLLATYRGDRRYDDRWPDLSAAARERRRAADARVLAELEAIPRAGLGADDQLNYDLFRHEYAGRVAAAPFRPEAWAITPLGGPQSLDEVAEQMPFATAADYQAWLGRLATLPQYLGQYEALLREAAGSGRTQPREIIERILAQVEQQLVAEPQDSPFFAPLRRFPEALPAAERERLAGRARELIASGVVPAYRRLLAMLRDEYLPACRATAGVGTTPDGAAWYANRIRHFTTTAATAAEIHALGLAEVERNRQAMLAVLQETGFRGTLAEAFAWLRSDPQFFHRTPDELFRAYVFTAKMIEPELPRLFGRLYRTPYGLRPIPAASAPHQTTAYYSGPALDGTRPGYYYVNLYRPEVRPKWEIEVLTVHEAVPGHHLQIALAQELTGVPQFRRFADFGAFVEGWALYAERLGYDLGLYRDPWSRFGQLAYDQWRAVRLVVDTGMHHGGWSRQQAIDYFLANAPRTEADVINEIDRYIAWPGQALGYKIGQLRILALRERAQAELGPRFDLRAFHDELLGAGALPLDLLGQRIDDWIARQRTP